MKKNKSGSQDCVTFSYVLGTILRAHPWQDGMKMSFVEEETQGAQQSNFLLEEIGGHGGVSLVR